MRFRPLLVLILIFWCSAAQSQWTRCGGFFAGKVTSLMAYGNYPFAVAGGKLFYSYDTTDWMELPTPGDNVTALGYTGQWLLITAQEHIYRAGGFGFDPWEEVDSGITPLVTSYVTNGNLIFAGAEDGVYRSSDAGKSWMKTSLETASVYSLVKKGNSVFAGTAQPGVYRTTDDGTTWVAVDDGLLNSTILLHAAHVVALDTMGTDLFAGVNSTGLDPAGVFRSTNEGASWTQVNSGLTDTNINALAINGTTIFAATNHGLFNSTNNGASWEQNNSGLTGDKVLSLAVYGSSKFGGKVVLYAGTDHGVFLTRDNGNTWVAVNSGMGIAPQIAALGVVGSTIYAGSGDQFTGYGIHLPSDSLETMGLFSSTDMGKSWVACDTIFDHHQIESIASKDSTIYVGSYGGIIRSTDNGLTWKRVLGSFKSQYDSAILYVSAHGTDVFALSDNYAFYQPAVLASHDRGEHWANIGLDFLPAGYYPSMLIFDSFVFVSGSSAESAIYRSSDEGANWRLDLDSINASCFTEHQGVIFAGRYRNGIMVSTDTGKTWEVRNTGFYPNQYGDTSVWSFAVSGNKVFVAGGGGIFVSADNGMTWENVNKGLRPNPEIATLAVAGGRLLASVSGDGVWSRSIDEMNGADANVTRIENQTTIRAYPNPIRSIATISSAEPLADEAHVQIENAIGQVIFDELVPRGSHAFVWNTSTVNSGTYWCIVRSGDHVQRIALSVQH